MERKQIEAGSRQGHRTISRRQALRLGAGTLAAAILAGKGATAKAMPAAVTAPDSTAIGQVFVGIATDLGTFIAIVLPPDGSTTARAYLCDGESTDAWLVGTVHDNQLDLHSTDWETLTAQVKDDGVNGSATLSDGRILDFTATRATDVQGLYDVVLAPDGRLTGQGSGGQQLAGRIVETISNGPSLLAGTLTAPGKVLRPFAVLASADAKGEQRWIVLSPGQIKGKAKATKGAGFIDENTTPFIDENSDPFIDENANP